MLPTAAGFPPPVGPQNVPTQLQFPQNVPTQLQFPQNPQTGLGPPDPQPGLSPSVAPAPAAQPEPQPGSKPQPESQPNQQQAKGKGTKPGGATGKAGAAARQAEHSKELIEAFTPIKYFLTLIGQMPFVIKPKKDGTYAFKFNSTSFTVLIYMFVFFISTALYLSVTIGMLSFMLSGLFKDINPRHKVVIYDKNERSASVVLWERHMIRHEMVSMIVVWSWQTVAFVGSLYIVTNSKYYVHYTNYFNRVVQLMDINMTPGVSHYLFYNNLLSLGIAVLLIFGFLLGQSTKFTAVTDMSSTLSNFIFRIYSIEIENSREKLESQFQIVGFFIIVYALFASRANVLQFLFFSQLLKNASKVWNERLRKVLTHEKGKVEDTNQFSRRLEPRLVYKDHLMIVQLYQMTENVFGTILFTYYSLTLISIVMELYQLVALQGIGSQELTEESAEASSAKQKLLHTRKGETTQLERAQEMEILATAAVALTLLALNVFFCYRTTVDAAKAYESAMKGFDILRRHGLMYARNKTDRNFVLSLYFSFAKNNPLQLSAGGYFAVNKILLVTMASTIVNWAISIYQTRVDQWK